jgi:predicted ArsR family transcriptional regulator
MTDAPGGEPAAGPAVRAVALLGDEVRHRLYEFVRAARGPVTREQAAAATGISRKLAAFHLDKLAEAGLLQASYATAGSGALGAPGAPGAPAAQAGRPPKLYQPSGQDLQVSIPARQHDELASTLIDAVLTQAPGETARQAAQRVARQHGQTLGAAARGQARPGRLGAERALALAGTALQRWGFEPDRAAPGCLRLRNCPFHPLAARAPELVCGMNHEFLAGFLDGLEARTVRAVLAPKAGECCVELRDARLHGQA